MNIKTKSFSAKLRVSTIEVADAIAKRSLERDIP